jgi:hypothetical protein
MNRTRRIYFLSDFERWADDYEFGWNTATRDVVTVLHNDANDYAEDNTIYWVDLDPQEFEEFIRVGGDVRSIPNLDDRIQNRTQEGDPRRLPEWCF